MKVRSLSLFLVLMGVSLAQPGATLTRDYCQQTARAHYPLQRNAQLLESAADLKLKNLSSQWLPQLAINGQSTYQSDVTSLPISIPGMSIPEPDQDATKLTLDLSSTLYDGGAIRRQKQLEQAGLLADQQSLEVELYKLRERIDQLYFSALLLQENKKLLAMKSNEIKARIKVVESGVRNGVSLQSNADVLSAGLIELELQMLELDHGKQAAFDMLAEFLGQAIPAGSLLEIPAGEVTARPMDIRRPELKLLALQSAKLDASKALLKARTNPRLMAFGQLGYGKPGLNMLANDFDTFYVLGLRFSWTPWDWHQTQNERHWIGLQQNMVTVQQETLEQNIRILLKKDLSEISKYEALIHKDDEIIALRSRITQTFSSQLENGVVTATDYLAELNAETQARLNQQLHVIQLAKARSNYQFDSGNVE